MKKLSRIYYSPKGYWKGIAAIKKLANAAKVSENEARSWLKKQAIWQIYLSPPRYIPRLQSPFAAPTPKQLSLNTQGVHSTGPLSS